MAEEKQVGQEGPAVGVIGRTLVKAWERLESSIDNSEIPGRMERGTRIPGLTPEELNSLDVLSKVTRRIYGVLPHRFPSASKQDHILSARKTGVES